MKVVEILLALAMIVVGVLLVGPAYVLLMWVAVGIRINNSSELDAMEFINIACTSAFWPFQIKQLVREFNA